MSLPLAVKRLVQIARGPSSETLAATIASQLFLAVSGIVAARALGVDGRGTLALLWLVPVVLTLLGGIGIPQAATFHIAREPEHGRRIVLVCLRILIPSAILLPLLYGAVMLLVDIGGHDYSTAEALMSAGLIPVLLAQNLGIASLLGQQRYRAYNFTRIMPAFLYMLLATVVLVSGGATVAVLLAAMAGSWLLAATATWAILARHLPDGEGEPRATGKDIFGFGLRGVVGSVSPIDDVRLDQFVVGLMLDARALGLYVAAIAFCNLPRLIAVSIGAVAYPKIAAGGVAARKIAARYLRIGLPLIAGAAAVVVLMLPFVLPLLFGDEFGDAVSIGRILLLGAAILATNRLLSEIARGFGHPGLGSIAEAVNGLVFLGGVLIVAGALTVTDVAWAVVSSALVSLAILVLLLLRLKRSPETADPLV